MKSSISRRRLTRGWRAAVAVFLTLSLPLAADAERIEREIRVGNRTREYVAYLPDNRGARDEWPVLVAFHPALAQGAYMEREARFHERRAGGNYVVVYPDGFRRTWNAGDCCGAAERRDIDDVAFFNAILRDIGAMVPTRDRAYVAGFSNGARMVYHLICTQPQTIAAAMAFAATRDMSNCARGQVPLMHVHGAADGGSPVEGGYADLEVFARRIGYMEPAREVIETVARRNGCRMNPRTYREPRLDTQCTAYRSCPADADAVLCVVPGLGHAWPGRTARIKYFGPSRPDLDLTAVTLDFFQRH